MVHIYCFLQGIKGRVYETLVILALLAVSVFGLVWVGSALFGQDLFEKQTSYGLLLFLMVECFCICLSKIF